MRKRGGLQVAVDTVGTVSESPKYIAGNVASMWALEHAAEP